MTDETVVATRAELLEDLLKATKGLNLSYHKASHGSYLFVSDQPYLPVVLGHLDKGSPGIEAVTNLIDEIQELLCKIGVL